MIWKNASNIINYLAVSFIGTVMRRFASRFPIFRYSPFFIPFPGIAIRNDKKLKILGTHNKKVPTIAATILGLK
jgi:hypothetical protein